MMIYKKSILKCLLVTAGILFIGSSWGFSQTCCSGGVPLSGNIGFEGADRGSIQMELSYDLNYLATLKIGSDAYADENRQRITQSLLLKGGYSVNHWFAIDALFTYVFQQRKNTFREETNLVSTQGLGDAVIMAKFIPLRISNSGHELQFGAGPKIPLGLSDLTDERGLTLNADLQPGSGSWDAITWGYFARQLKSRPSSVLSVRIVGRFNGVNREYFGSQTYQFGNSIQAYLGIGDQVLFGNEIISPSLSLRYRHARADKVNAQALDNTGGQWINVIPAISWQFRQNTIFHLIPEIPLYSNVEGIQLSPTFRMQLGIYHRFGGKKENKSNIYLL
jgi:hypothetical protein